MRLLFTVVLEFPNTGRVKAAVLLDEQQDMHLSLPDNDGTMVDFVSPVEELHDDCDHVFRSTKASGDSFKVLDDWRVLDYDDRFVGKRYEVKVVSWVEAGHA